MERRLQAAGQETEFLVLGSADGDKLYVPVASLHLISRYTGSSPETAPLHRLGSRQWEKARRKAAEKARDVAVELLAQLRGDTGPVTGYQGGHNTAFTLFNCTGNPAGQC